MLNTAQWRAQTDFTIVKKCTFKMDAIAAHVPPA